VDQLDEKALFARALTRPLKRGDPVAIRRVQVLLGSLALRRTKDTNGPDGRPVVRLPGRRVALERCEMAAEQRAAYLRWEAFAARVVEQLDDGEDGDGGLLRNYAHVLELILRLRQLCCHPGLCPRELPALPGGGAGAGRPAPEAVVARLEAVLAEGALEECPICLDAIPAGAHVITMCAHVFCRACIEAVLALDKPLCPLCRAGVRPSGLFGGAEGGGRRGGRGAGEEGARGAGRPEGAAEAAARGAKLARLRELVAAGEGERTASGRPVKHVVFSQFRGMLDLAEALLAADGVPCARLDGSVPAAERAARVRAFARGGPGSPRVFLVALQAGGTGLNLVAATRVHLLDPWWNPAVEEQAMDRVHRIGQPDDVTVHRYVCADSIEERVLQLQDRKRELSARAFGRENTAADRRRERAADIRLLFGRR